MLFHNLIILLESLCLSISSVPNTGLIQTGPAAHKPSHLSAPGYKVAAAVLPPTVLLTWAVSSLRRDMSPPIPVTTPPVADHDDFQPLVTFAPVCSAGSYDGPDEMLRLVTGQCDIPYFVQSTKPNPVKPPTSTWPTCSLTAYDGPDLALHREDGICDVEIPIFQPAPQDTQDAQKRVLASLPLDPYQVIDRLRYLGRRFLVLWDTVYSDLDWPVMHALFDKIDVVFHLVTLAVGTSVSHIWFLFDKAQAFKPFVDLFGHEYCSLLAQALLEMARQMSGLIIELGCGFSGFFLDVVGQISLVCLKSKLMNVLYAKVDWAAVLPLPRRPVQLFLVFVITFLVGCGRLRVSHSPLNSLGHLNYLSTKASEV